MSTPVNQNPLANIAAQLSAPSSNEERLFQQALRAVCLKSSDPKAVEVVNQLRQIQKPEDISGLFTQWRMSSKVWQQDGSTPLSRKVAKVLAFFLEFKGIGDGLVQFQQSVAVPVWSLLCTCLAVAKGLLETDDSLNLVEQNLQDSLVQISAAYIPGHAISTVLATALNRLYESIIEFSLRIAALLREATIKSWARLVTKDLYNALKTFDTRFTAELVKFDRALNLDDLADRKQMKSSRAFSPNVQQSATTVTRCVYLPGSTSTSFVGRTKELDFLKSSIASKVQQDVTKTAIWGVGGVGKSTLALQHLQSIRSDQALSQHSLFFVQAHTEFSLLSEFSIIGEKLEVGDSAFSEAEPKKLRERIKNWLERCPGWVIVFDNVSDSSYLRDYIPSTGHGQVLFTTRSQQVAAAMTTPENTINLSPLDPGYGVQLVFNASQTPNKNPRSPVQQATAREIVKLAGGLPMMIEQVVKNADRMQIPWDSMVAICRNRNELLKQRGFCSNHEMSESVGGIVQASLESLDESEPKAVALFRLLAYLAPASIKLVMLHNAKAQLQEHFQRPWTYTLGSKSVAAFCKVPTLEADRRQRMGRTRLAVDIRKILRGSSGGVPRADSEADIELQEFWQSQQKCLQEVLDNPIYVDSAINILTNAGLVRRTDTRTIWIHDLFSELTQALVEVNARKDHEVNAHLASTMVYLAFPVPTFSWPEVETLAVLLPHAIAVHATLKAAGLLMKATVGPELSHIIASSLECTRQPLTASNIDLTDMIQYLKDAFLGYKEACRRFETALYKQRRKTTRYLLSDFEMEDQKNGLALVGRYLHGYERLGRGPHWRSINTGAKLGLTLCHNDQTQEGLEYLMAAANWYEGAFGLSSPDTCDLLREIATIHYNSGNYEAAYRLTMKRAKSHMELVDPDRGKIATRPGYSAEAHMVATLARTENGGAIGCDLGRICLKIPARTGEALKWFELSLAVRRRIYGDDLSSGAFLDMAKIYLSKGDNAAVVHWRARALEAEVDRAMRKINQTDEVNWRDGHSFDDNLAEDIVNFNSLVAEVPEISDAVRSYVQKVDAKAQVWQGLRREYEARVMREKERDDAEFADFEEKFQQFHIDYHPACHVSYNESLLLFRKKEEVLGEYNRTKPIDDVPCQACLEDEAQRAIHD